ncbi:MAG TPA: hypothetical protein VFM08_04815 [Nocardioides sp.]|jgi:hypothetical protein|nr:hypothetical protein [Nocardioides sp.]
MSTGSTPRPHMWGMYIRALLPDASAEPLPADARDPVRRRTRGRRRRIDRARRLPRTGTRADEIR